LQFSLLLVLAVYKAIYHDDHRIAIFKPQFDIKRFQCQGLIQEMSAIWIPPSSYRDVLTAFSGISP